MITQNDGIKEISHLRELPVIGSVFAYNRDRLDFYKRIFQECGDAGYARFGPLRINLFSSSEAIQQLLVENNNHIGISPIVKNAFAPLAANGLLTSEGEFHRQQRKLLAPSFQPRSISAYAAIMATYSEQAQSQWADGDHIDIGQEMTRITMSIIGKVLFDTDLFNEADELGNTMKTVIDHVDLRLSYPLPSPWHRLLPGYSRAKKEEKKLRNTIQKMIEMRRSEEKNDLLSLLLRAEEGGKCMSDQQIYDEVLTLIFAGHDTIAQALTWAWYLLATHPDIYEKMQQEIDTLQDRIPTYEDLTHLPYTLQILKEAMRLYPPIHAIVRLVIHRDGIIDNFRVRKGDTIIVSPYINHHRPDYFPDPEKFSPERFTPENERKLPRHAFIPFGAGSRICIGNHFALMEGHLLLATIAQRITFELLPGQRIRPDPKVTLRSRSGIQVRVRRREKAEAIPEGVDALS